MPRQNTTTAATTPARVQLSRFQLRFQQHRPRDAKRHTETASAASTAAAVTVSIRKS